MRIRMKILTLSLCHSLSHSLGYAMRQIKYPAICANTSQCNPNDYSNHSASEVTTKAVVCIYLENQNRNACKKNQFTIVNKVTNARNVYVLISPI